MNKNAFTLLEALVALAIVLILVGALAGLGSYLKTQSAEQFTASAIEVVDTALEQYHGVHSDFPPQINNKTDWETWEISLGLPAGSTITLVSGSAPAGDAEFWQSSVLFYYLDHTPQSRTFLESLSAKMITNKDYSGVKLTIQIPTGGTTYDLVRIVDAWGKPLRYLYAAGDAFPQIISAGADKTFDTADDIKNF